MWTYRLEDWVEGGPSEADWLAAWHSDGWVPWLKDGTTCDLNGVTVRRWNLRRWKDLP